MSMTPMERVFQERLGMEERPELTERQSKALEKALETIPEMASILERTYAKGVWNGKVLPEIPNFPV